MLFPPIPPNEKSRLASLHSLNILDTPVDVRFDCITRFAMEKLNVPICLITFIDKDRQWFKSSCGVSVKEIPRHLSICAHAIYDTSNEHPKERIFEISDLRKDGRFFDNPQVASDPHLQSYISFVIRSDSGMNIGTLCLVDIKPRKFDNYEIDLIIELGLMAQELSNGRNVRSRVDGKLN